MRSRFDSTAESREQTRGIPSKARKRYAGEDSGAARVRLLDRRTRLRRAFAAAERKLPYVTESLPFHRCLGAATCSAVARHAASSNIYAQTRHQLISTNYCVKESSVNACRHAAVLHACKAMQYTSTSTLYSGACTSTAQHDACTCNKADLNTQGKSWPCARGWNASAVVSVEQDGVQLS